MNLEAVAQTYNYRPPTKEPKENISARVPASLKRRVDGLVRTWKMIAKARGDDPDDIDQTHVVNVLLGIACDGAYESLGNEPSSDDDWLALEKAIEKKYSKK